MRILLAIVDLAGGSGTYCRLLAQALHRFHGDQFRVELLLMHDTSVVPTDRDTFAAIHILGRVVHENWRRLYEPLRDLLRLRRALRHIHADLVVTVGNYMNLLLPLAAPRRNIILTVHNALSRQMSTTRFGRLLGWMMHRRYRQRLVVAPSEGVIDDLRRHFAIGRTRVIPHGIDIDRVRAMALQPAESIPDAPYLLAVGRLAVQKDYPTMLRAYAAAVSRGLAEHLVILGDGPEKPAIEALLRQLGLGQRVHLLGHRDNPFPYMRQARGFVLSSIFEGFGLVLLEAMALGVPCISTDCPSGPAEILRDGQDGILVPVGDIGKLADAMLRLTSDQALHDDLAARSLRRAEQLSLQRMAAAYRDLFLAELGAAP